MSSPRSAPFALLAPLFVALSAGRAGSAAPPGASGPAIVALVSGSCSVRTAAGAPAQPLHLLDRVSAGARVEAGSDARLVLVFGTGERFELASGASATVLAASLGDPKGPVRPLAPVPAEVALAALAAPLEVSRRAGAVRVRGEEHPAMYPADGAVLAGSDAVLRFAAVPGAERYAVAVEDEAGNTVFSAQTGATRVALPSAVLREGATYFWRVRARGPGLSGTGREERFATLGASEARRWDEARASLPASDPSLRALLAATASSLGLRREACLASRPETGASPAPPWATLSCESLGPLLEPD